MSRTDSPATSGNISLKACRQRELLHDPSRRDDDRRSEVAVSLLRHNYRPALDRPRKRRPIGLPVRLPAAKLMREGRRCLITRSVTLLGFRSLAALPVTSGLRAHSKT